MTNPAIADAVVVQPARDPDRRQGARHHQPDRLGRRPARPVRPRRRAADRRRSSSSCGSCFPARTSRSSSNADAVDAVRTGVEHTGHAARGRDRTGGGAQGQRHQHAAGARRERRAAGDAAGPVRRGEPARAHRARRLVLHRGAGYKNWIGRGTTQQFPAPDFDDDEELGLQRLPEPVPLQHELQHRRADQGAASRRGYFQSLAEPNLIAYNGQEASFLAGGEFPVPFVSGGRQRRRSSSRSSAFV